MVSIICTKLRISLQKSSVPRFCNPSLQPERKSDCGHPSPLWMDRRWATGIRLIASGNASIRQRIKIFQLRTISRHANCKKHLVKFWATTPPNRNPLICFVQHPRPASTCVSSPGRVHSSRFARYLKLRCIFVPLIEKLRLQLYTTSSFLAVRHFSAPNLVVSSLPH